LHALGAWLINASLLTNEKPGRRFRVPGAKLRISFRRLSHLREIRKKKMHRKKCTAMGEQAPHPEGGAVEEHADPA